MATPISRDTLNQETNARFWATGYRPGHKLDPKNPTDKAMMPVWMDIFRKVSAEAEAGTLVTTYDRPEVAQLLADAEIANAVAAMHVDEAAKASDPAIAQQHTAAAATASQVSSLKLSAAAANQPPTVSPKVVQDAAREAAKTPPPPHAPAADHIAHTQTQKPPQNGQPQNGKVLRPEEDPWGARYVPTSKSPREQPPAQPSKSPRERPSRDVLVKESNLRFWLRTNWKPGQKLDMSNAQDREMSKIWMEIFGEVQREANEGRLTFTNPELAPAPNGVRPPPSRPMPPPMQQPMPPPGMQPPGMQPWPPPGMQQPMPPPQPGMQPGMQQPMWPTPGAPTEGGPPPPSPTEAPTPTEPTTEGAPAEAAGMSTTAKIALGVAGLVGLAAVVYGVTRKPAPAGRTVSFRPRSKSTMAAADVPSYAFPPARGARGGRS